MEMKTYMIWGQLRFINLRLAVTFIICRETYTLGRGPSSRTEQKEDFLFPRSSAEPLHAGTSLTAEWERWGGPGRGNEGTAIVRIKDEARTKAVGSGSTGCCD